MRPRDSEWDDDPPGHTERECAALLGALLSTPAELLAALAPDGWADSPLVRVRHPTVEQRQAEADAIRRNFERLLDRPPHDSPRAGAAAAPDQAPDHAPDADAKPIEPEREVVDLLGHVLWDVFSDNHSVVDADGVEFDLGSFRGSAGFIAEELNRRYPELGFGYDYMDFYMGTVGIGDRADLGPVYRWVFARLRDVGCDWRYAFPRLYLVSFADEPGPADALTYDPSDGVRRELEAAERRRETDAMREQLEALHDEAVEEARRRPPPRIVAAYRDVFGAFPRGWPPPRADEWSP